MNGEVIAFEKSSGVYLNLNSAGRVLWQALVLPVSIGDLGGLLAESFSISKEQADSDAASFVEELAARSLVERVV